MANGKMRKNVIFQFLTLPYRFLTFHGNGIKAYIHTRKKLGMGMSPYTIFFIHTNPPPNLGFMGIGLGMKPIKSGSHGYGPGNETNQSGFHGYGF